MLEKITKLSTKGQFLCFMAVIAGYFSPLLGVMLYVALKIQKADKYYQRLPLLGAAAAVLYYLVCYWFTVLM